MRRRPTVIPPPDPTVIAELVDLRRAILDDFQDDEPPELIGTTTRRPGRGRDIRPSLGP